MKKRFFLSQTYFMSAFTVTDEGHKMYTHNFVTARNFKRAFKRLLKKHADFVGTTPDKVVVLSFNQV